MTPLTDLMENEHFQALAAIIRKSLVDTYWRVHLHPELPIWTRWEQLQRVSAAPYPGANPEQHLEALRTFLDMIVKAAPGLRYTEADWAWYVSQIDSGTHHIAQMLLAYGSAKEGPREDGDMEDPILTPEEHSDVMRHLNAPLN